MVKLINWNRDFEYNLVQICVTKIINFKNLLFVETLDFISSKYFVNFKMHPSSVTVLPFPLTILKLIVALWIMSSIIKNR